jgi:dipeptidyl aminopeptidase/acylaminoacyl peptidase
MVPLSGSAFKDLPQNTSYKVKQSASAALQTPGNCLQKWMKAAWLSVLTGMLAVMLSAARADYDIVYSARYYNPPGRRGLTHWHLYRINPGGTNRRQLTFGTQDDLMPRWSPDGKQIAFVRTLYEEYEPPSALYLIPATGGAPRRLLNLSEVRELSWSPDGKTLAIIAERGKDDQRVDKLLLLDPRTRHLRTLGATEQAAWSPDSRYVLGCGGHILEARNGRTVSTIPTLGFAHWLNRTTLVNVGLVTGPTVRRYATRIDIHGHEVKRVWLKLSNAELARGWHGTVIPVPRHPNILITEEVLGTSTAHSWGYRSINSTTGNVRELARGLFLSFSPDGKRFCTSPQRELGPYGKNREGRPRTVWVSHLQVGAVSDGRVRVITPGTVWVLDGDWRH